MTGLKGWSRPVPRTAGIIVLMAVGILIMVDRGFSGVRINVG